MAVILWLGLSQSSGVLVGHPASDSIQELPTFWVEAEKGGSKNADRIPISMSVFEGNQTRGFSVAHLSDLSLWSPSTHVAQGNDAMEVTIRGISSNNYSEIGEPAVGYLIDGFAYSRPEAAGIALHDVNRIEVLRGPQGTLYGRNTIGGVVNVVTNRPQFETQRTGSFMYGSHASTDFEGVLNLKTSNTSALRVSGAYHQNDGYWEALDSPSGEKRNLGWGNTKAVRLQYLAELPSDLSILLTGSLARIGGTWSPFFLRETGGTISSEVDIGWENSRNDRFQSITIEVIKNNEAFRLAYLGGWNREKTDQQVVTALEPLPNPFLLGGPKSMNQEHHSHEFRISSQPFGRFEWVLGGYYAGEENDVRLLVPLAGVGFVQPEVKNNAGAVFGNCTFEILDKLRMHAGLRLSRDRKARTGGLFAVDPSGNVGPLLLENRADRVWKSTDWKVGLEYDINEQAFLFGSVSTGFKTGGFYDGSGDVYYDPEKVVALETGIKGRSLNERYLFQAWAFFYDYSDYQVSSIEVNPVTQLLGSVTRNIPSLSVSGAELEAIWQLTANQQLRTSFSLLSSSIGRFEFGEVSSDGAFIRRNLKGNSLPMAPRYSGTVSYKRSASLGSDYRIDMELRSAWTAGYHISYDNHPIPPHPTSTRQSGFTRSDFIVSFYPSSLRWSGSVFVKNLEDKRVMVSNGGNIKGDIAVLSKPMTYGLRLNVVF